jgi:hypothetical protein
VGNRLIVAPRSLVQSLINEDLRSLVHFAGYTMVASVRADHQHGCPRNASLLSTSDCRVEDAALKYLLHSLDDLPLKLFARTQVLPRRLIDLIFTTSIERDASSA